MHGLVIRNGTIVDANVSVGAAIIPILTLMFPASVSHVWWPDRF